MGRIAVIIGGKGLNYLHAVVKLLRRHAARGRAAQELDVVLIRLTRIDLGTRGVAHMNLMLSEKLSDSAQTILDFIVDFRFRIGIHHGDAVIAEVCLGRLGQTQLPANAVDVIRPRHDLQGHFQIIGAAG